MSRKYTTIIRGIGILGAVLTVVSAYFLFQRTTAWNTLRTPATRELLLEMAILFLLFAVAYFLPKERKISLLAGAAVILGFLWIHQILVPILVAGIYLLYLILLGRTMLDLVNSGCPFPQYGTDPGDTFASVLFPTEIKSVPGEKNAFRGKSMLRAKFIFGCPAGSFLSHGRSLLLGASVQLVITAAFSACGIGGAGFFRMQSLALFAAVCLYRFLRSRQICRQGNIREDTAESLHNNTHDNPQNHGLHLNGLHNISLHKTKETTPQELLHFLLLAVPIIALLLQAGRMNIALDYDSLHYELRSIFVLDNGGGIYQNLGSVNDVYLYPKGLEALCLPLADLCSGSFVTAVSWWFTVGTLWTVCSIVHEKKAGLCAVLCVCCVPGIMNMAASAKTDAATLFFQLYCVAEFVAAIRNRERKPGRGLSETVRRFLRRRERITDDAGTRDAVNSTGMGQLPRGIGASCGNMTDGSFLCGLAAAIFTWILKPTSYLFSLLIILAALPVYLIGTGNRKKTGHTSCPAGRTAAAAAETGTFGAKAAVETRKTATQKTDEVPEEKQETGFCEEEIRRSEESKVTAQKSTERRTAILILLMSIFAYVLITLRTVHIAGVPLTTVGGSLWQLLGFEKKYPFAGLDAYGDEGQSLIKRLIGVFACPVGEDMFHVYIAWGGLLPALCILKTVIRLGGTFPSGRFRSRGTFPDRRKSVPAEQKFLLLCLGLVLPASVACIGALYQVDGNYFMLLYALAVICAFLPAEQVSESAVHAEGKAAAAAPQFMFLKSLFLPLLYGALVCCITNWAGIPGLTEPRLIHKGYVNQIELDRQAQAAKGTGELYAFLETRPTARVLAMAVQPDCLVYRCNVQSYTDLEDSGGNVYLVKKLVLFKEFLNYAREDYILTEDSFLAEHSRAAEIVGYMLDDGSLLPVWEGAGVHLYRYVAEETVSETGS